MQFYTEMQRISKLIEDAMAASEHDRDTASQLLLAAKSEADAAVEQMDRDVEAEYAAYLLASHAEAA